MSFENFDEFISFFIGWSKEISISRLETGPLKRGNFFA